MWWYAGIIAIVVEEFGRWCRCLQSNGNSRRGPQAMRALVGNEVGLKMKMSVVSGCGLCALNEMLMVDLVRGRMARGMCVR